MAKRQRKLSQPDPFSTFQPNELRKLRALNTPQKIQAFLDQNPYNLADTAWSPRKVLAHKSAHCLEGAVFAACALRLAGYPPLIVDLEAVNDVDHVIAVYQKDGAWGSIASSNYSGIRGRSPVYRSLRELALSYFEDYFNLRGERTLRTFSNAVDLSRFDKENWMGTDKAIWFIAEHLLKIPHTKLLTKSMEKNLSRIDSRTLKAGLVGYRKK